MIVRGANIMQPVNTVPRCAVALGYGALCHVSFAVGVTTMMAAMYFGMSRSLGPMAYPWNWLANAVLLVQFPVIHSLLLSRPGRVVLARLAPAGTGTVLSTTTFVVVASVQIVALFGLWSPTGTVWWRADGDALAVLTAAYVAAWLLLLKAMADAGLGLQTGSMGWIALLRNRKPVYPAMPVTGTFSYVRQPIYLAFALTLWTVPTWTPDQLVLALSFTGYCVFAPLLKEARYRRMYGPAFDAYRSSVPYWLPWPRRGREAPVG